MYVTSVSSFDSKCSEFLLRIQEFANLFEDITIFKDSIALLVTKVRPEEEEEERDEIFKALEVL